MLIEKDHHCRAKTKRGKPCGAAATAGGLCYFHANPLKASELGRLGGKSKRHVVAVGLDPLPALDNAKSILEFAVRLSNELYFGQLSPRIADSLLPMIHLLLRSVEAINWESRIAHLEDIFARSDVRPGPWVLELSPDEPRNETNGGSSEAVSHMAGGMAKNPIHNA